MPSAKASVRRPPPGTAIAAAVLGALSATVPGLFFMVWLVLAGEDLGLQSTVWLLVPAGLAAGLVVGAVLLLLGRAWLPLVVSAAAVAALVVLLSLDSGGVVGPYGVLTLLLPLAAAVLGALPDVRRWVRDRRSDRVAR
jgi:hypothetical protein